ERLVGYRTAEASDTAEELLPSRREAIERGLEHVMLALHQVAAHVEPRRRGDVARLLEVAHDQAGQQPQAEGMVAVRSARRLDLGARAADALGAEERHRIGGLHLLEGFLAAPKQQIAAPGLDYARANPRGEQHLGL